MRFYTGDDLKQALFLKARSPNGENIECFGFDTKEKWIECYVKKNGRWLLRKGKLYSVRKYIDFEIYNRFTGQILYTVRQ